jgi:hypothetical protein
MLPHERYCAEDNLAVVTNPSEAKVTNQVIPYFFESFIAHDGSPTAGTDTTVAATFLPCEALLDLYPADWPSNRLTAAAKGLALSSQDVNGVGGDVRVSGLRAMKGTQKLATDLRSKLQAITTSTSVSSSSSSTAPSPSSKAALSSAMASLMTALDTAACDDEDENDGDGHHTMPLEVSAWNNSSLDHHHSAEEGGEAEAAARAALFWGGGRSKEEGGDLASVMEASRYPRRKAYGALRALVELDLELSDLLHHHRRRRQQHRQQQKQQLQEEEQQQQFAPQFVVGEVVKHSKYGYRGVVVRFDPEAAIDVSG